MGVDHGVDLVPRGPHHLLRRRDRHVPRQDLHRNQAATVHDRARRVRRRAGSRMTEDTLRAQARAYYETKLRVHGATPAGMDWNSQASQELRFAQLARLWDETPDAGVVDYGCGYGA